MDKTRGIFYLTNEGTARHEKALDLLGRSRADREETRRGVISTVKDVKEFGATRRHHLNQNIAGDKYACRDLILLMPRTIGDLFSEAPCMSCVTQ
ncbi:hypothetical protein [Caballeronia sp. DA-9]|uniref:hypothetical protein n=1 Tax=Caballeronia sp. DA-9 TaxID=3436237 RepID=UPI003F664FE8